MAEKKINKILWHGNELDADGNAKAPAVATGADGLDGLNDGEVYICDADKDPAMFIKTDAGRVARLGGSGGDTYTKEQINQLLAGKVDTAFFSRLFGLMTDAGGEIAVNDVQTAAASIFAKLGLYTNSFLSALGLDDSTTGGGGGGGATTLGELANVGEWADEVPQTDRVMVQLSGATHWSSKPLSELVGLDTEALADYLAENKYATQSWVTGQGYATEEWVAGKDYATQSWVNGMLEGYSPADHTHTFASLTSKPSTLAGYGITDAYTKQETDTKLSAKLDKETFEELFEKVELPDGTFAIHAKFGLYSDSFLSALGMNPDGGSGGASSLSELSDVSLSGLQDGQALTWDAAAQKWVNKTLEAGLDEEALAEYLTDNQYAKKSDISIAGLTDLHSSWDALLKAAKPATLAGYGITDAYTKTDADGRYVLKTGDTITGNLSVMQIKIQNTNEINVSDSTNSNGLYIAYRETSRGVNLCFNNSPLTYGSARYAILHAGNYTSTLDSRYVKKAGDTMSGDLTAHRFVSTYNDFLLGDSSYTNGRLHFENSTLYLQSSLNGKMELCGRNTSQLANFTIKVASHSVATINDHVIWTAGNDGSGSGLDADTVDGLHATDFARADQSPTVDLNTVNGIGIMSNPTNADATTARNYPIQEAGTLFYGTAAYSSANQIYGTYNSNRWFFRGGGDSATAKTAWKEMAFLTSNVYSATKLQTARTIWGQTFDGTGNVDGIIAITSNGNTLRIGSQNSSWYHIYGDQGRPFIVNNKFCTSGNHDLGESNYKWGKLYLSGYAYIDGWFQNNANGCGLYNLPQDARWYAQGGCWNTDKPIIPKANNTQSVGTSPYRFNYGYFTNMDLSGGLAVTGGLTANGIITCNNNIVFNKVPIVNTGAKYLYFGDDYAYGRIGWENSTNFYIQGVSTGGNMHLCARNAGKLAVIDMQADSVNLSDNLTAQGTIYSKIGVYSDGYVSCLGVDSTSDARLKEVLRPVRIPLEAMAQAPAVAFRWKSGRGEDIGGLAQYWLGIEPLAVKEGKGGWLTMNYAGLAYVNTVSLAGELLAVRDEVRILREEIRQMKANRAA